jgi:DNA repair exonuclease SbcCD ATPase subunit
MADLTPDDVDAVRKGLAWLQPLVRMAELAVTVAELPSRHEAALRKLAIAEKVANDWNDAAQKAQQTHQETMTQLSREMDAHQSAVASRVSAELVTVQQALARSKADLEKQQGVYAEMVQQARAEIEDLKRQRDALTATVTSLKSYVEKAKAAVQSVG